MLKSSVLICTLVIGWFAYNESYGARHQDVTPELTPKRIELLKEIAGVSNQGRVSSSYSVDAPELTPQRIKRLRVIAGTFDESQRLPNTEVALIAADHTSALIKAGQPDQSSRPITKYNDSYSLADSLADSAEGLRDRGWILNQDADHYTIQLALTINKPFLLSFAKQLPSGFDATVFPERLTNGGNIQFSLSTGSFPSKKLAQASLRRLPSKIRKYGAYARKFEELHRSSI